ncbi:hypothetical protein [Microbacterium enclense]|uniref:hypothetical protein n=1 Tax=Microbacterium enclense TaxID=993073 RepID=UPI00344ADEB7
MNAAKRGRGRPRREHQIRIRAERREIPDYDKLARALLEHAAMEQAKKTPPVLDPAVDSDPSVIDEHTSSSTDNAKKTETDGGGQ